MDLPDPLLEAEPDFPAERFSQTRQELAGYNMPDEAITNVLRQVWIASRQARHEDWEADRQRRQQGSLLPREKNDQNDRSGTPQAKALKANSFPQGVAVPDAESPRPSEYARQKAAEFEYIELWYFTREGLVEAALPVTSMKASKNALDDEALSWDQVSFASKVYVKTLRSKGWPDQHVKALVRFFTQLDYQRTMLTYIPDPAFIEYQATVRREWMSTWNFDISEFSLSRLQAIHSRIMLHSHQTALVSATSNPPRS